MRLCHNCNLCCETDESRFHEFFFNFVHTIRVYYLHAYVIDCFLISIFSQASYDAVTWASLGQDLEMPCTPCTNWVGHVE